MTPSVVNWTPAIVVLTIGFGVGLFLLWRLRAAAPAALPIEPAVRDLVARRDALVAQLRELDETASKHSPADLERERQRLEIAAARVLMELDRQSAGPRTKAASGGRSAATAPRAGGSTLRGFLWGVGSVGGLLLLFYLASQSGRPRTDTAPAEAETGANTPADAQIAALRAQIAKNPEDLASRLELARHSLAANDMMSVFNETRFVLDRSPDEPRALTYQAVVRLAMGQPKKAEEMIERAIAAQPALEDAYVYLMLVHTETGNARAADAVLQRAIARLPSEAEALRSVLARMRSDASAGAAAARELPQNPHAALDRSSTPESVPRAASAPSDQGVSGTVDLTAKVTLPASSRAAIYVSVRRAGQTDGPPLAVKRLPATTFPVLFEIDAADSMTGAAMPGAVRIEARLAADGDAATRSPDEPRAAADGVPLGTRDVRLTLAPLP